MAKRRIKRNDQCWCGSGRKYKNCHLNRADETPVKISDMMEASKRLERRVCSHPDAGSATCSGKIIRAHTVQRAGLERIAENSLVYAYPTGFGAMVSNKGVIAPQTRGINQASTFTGFCGKHDSDTFAPIEDQPFKACRQHAFLLGYRTLCRELEAKRAQTGSTDFLRQLDRGKSLPSQIQLQYEAGQIAAGSEKGLEDLQGMKAQYDAALCTGDYSMTQYYVIGFDSCPTMLCSGGVKPSIDFEGNRLQDLVDLNVEVEGVHLNMIAVEDSGAAVFTWKDINGSSEQLVKSLKELTDTEIPNALVRFAFEFLENKFWRISWWDNLPQDQIDQLNARTQLAFNPMAKRSVDCLADDGVRAANWRVTYRETNVASLTDDRE